MAECASCGKVYFPTASTRWGAVCGECLAREIELTLLSAIRDAQRKPARRASDVSAGHAVEQQVQRRA